MELKFQLVHGNVTVSEHCFETAGKLFYKTNIFKNGLVVV